MNYLSAQTVAEIYCVKQSLVEEVIDCGLVGEAGCNGHRYVVEITMLERVAEIIRLHVHHGLSLDGVAAFLPSETGDRES